MEISESSKIGATQFIDDENNENTDLRVIINNLYFDEVTKNNGF